MLQSLAAGKVDKGAINRSDEEHLEENELFQESHEDFGEGPLQEWIETVQLV